MIIVAVFSVVWCIGLSIYAVVESERHANASLQRVMDNFAQVLIQERERNRETKAAKLAAASEIPSKMTSADR
jgi:hypothetical protein